MMLRFISTLCVGALLVIGVGLWFGSQALPASVSGALSQALSGRVEAMRSVATRVADSGDSMIGPEAEGVEGLLGWSENPVVEIAQTIPDPPAPFLESTGGEISVSVDRQPSEAGRSPELQAGADRIRRMLAIYERVAEER